MSLQLITAATIDPVSDAEAKAHLRITHDDDNVYIQSLIKAATNSVENFLNRALLSQEWEYRLHGFPKVICLPMAPLISVVSVKYLDSGGTEQTLSSSYYSVSTSDPAYIVPSYGSAWPVTRSEIEAMRVRYIAGYGADADYVPAAIRQGVLITIADLYVLRQSVSVAAPVYEVPGSVKALLWPYVAARF